MNLNGLIFKSFRHTNISKSKWTALIILIVCLILTFAVSLYTKYFVDAKEKQEYFLVCNEIKTKISMKLHTYSQVLRAGAAFIEETDTITYHKWKAYYNKLKLNENFPGIQGIGFSKLIPQKELNNHIEYMKHQGFQNYKIEPEGDRSIYTSIIYLEPFAGRNLRAFGYDMYSEPIRQKAMEMSRDSDLAILSGKVCLKQETKEDVQAGALMYVPVYNHRGICNTVEKRRASIYGWVFSPFRMKDLMNGIVGQWNYYHDRRIQLQIFDTDTMTGKYLLFDTQAFEKNNKYYTDRLTLILPIEFNGKKWSLHFTQSGQQYQYIDSIIIFVFICGLLISILLFALSLSLINSKNKTKELRSSESKYNAMIFNISDVISIINADGIIKYVSTNVSKYFGWLPGELINTSNLLTVHPDDSDSIRQEFGNLIVMENSTKAIEYQYKCKDNTYKWIGLTAINLTNNPLINGILINFRDITNRKKSENEQSNLIKQLSELNETIENTLNQKNALIEELSR